MIKNFILLLGALIVLSINMAVAEPPTKESEATKAALSWLALVDAGNYAASWDSAAGYFKKAVPKQQWVQMVSAVRSPLGKVISRTPKSATYKTALPGAPDGQYVVIQFNTSFTNKKTAIETITPMLDSDKKWHVSGYYIK